MSAHELPPPPPTMAGVLQQVIRVLTGAGVIAAVLTAAFFIVRATGILDRHVQSQRLAPVTDWQKGLVIYRLNRTALELTATFEITACKTVSIDPLQGDVAGDDKKTRYRLVSVSIADDKLTPRVEPDPTHAWAILPDTIESAWWSTTFTVTLDARGRLTEVNSTSTSLRAQDVVKPFTDLLGQWVGSAGTQVARPVASSGEALDDATFCGPAISEALTRQLAIETRLKANPPAEEAALLRDQLVKVKAVLRKPHSSTLVPRRPPAAFDLRAATAEQLHEHGLGVFVDLQDLFPEAGDGLKRELGERAFELRILAEASTAPTAATPATVNGIVHRIPAQVSVVTCKKRCVPDERGSLPPFNVLKGPEVIAIPQLGADIAIAIRRTPFSDRRTKLTFDPSGVLTAVDMGDTAQLPK